MKTLPAERTSASIQSAALFSVNDKLPRWGQRVMVVTPVFESLGFFGPDAEWRHARDGSPIEDVQSWYAIAMEGEAATS
jgi:hypothetical protein